MRLLSILEGIWPHNIKLHGPYSEPVNVYLALDGVLSEPDWGEMAHRYKTDKNLKAFYARVIKNQKLIDTAANLIKSVNSQDTSKKGNLYIAAYSIPRDLRINPTVLQQAIIDWAHDNYPQIPQANILFSKPKGVGASDILVDRNIDNIRGWQESQGVGILYDAKKPNFAIRSLKAPPGPMSAKIDVEKEGMFTTDFSREDRKLSQTGQFQIKDEEDGVLRNYRVFIDKIALRTESGESKKMSVFSPYSTDNKAEQYLFGLLKKEKDPNPSSPDPEHAEYALNEFVERAAVCLSDNFLKKAGPFGSIHIPASGSEVAINFASVLQDELGIPSDSIYVWTKNKDPQSVIVNQEGVKQVAYGNLVRDFKLTSNTRSKKEVKSDNERLVFDALRSGAITNDQLEEYLNKINMSWKKQATEWVLGNKATKNLDPHIRRGNLLNLYVPPANLDVESLAGTKVLLADDVVTFGMTLINIATSLLKAGAEDITAATIYKFM